MPTAPNSITTTALAVISGALQEIGALSPGETVPQEDQAWVLQKLQRLVDRYNARKPMVYNVNFTVYTLNPPADPNDPTTIGPGGDFDVNQRPVDIISIGLILNGETPGVEVLMNKRDNMWWANNRIKALTSTLPTDFFYSETWPLGEIFFWPVPSASHQVRLQTRDVLTEIASFAQQISLPPAYWDLMIYDLAVSLAPSYERTASPELIGLRREALKAVQVNNIKSPRLESDSPSHVGKFGDGRPDYNFLTGLSR